MLIMIYMEMPMRHKSKKQFIKDGILISRCL